MYIKSLTCWLFPAYQKKKKSYITHIGGFRLVAKYKSLNWFLQTIYQNFFFQKVVLLLFVNSKCLLQKKGLQNQQFKRMPGAQQGMNKPYKTLMDSHSEKSCKSQLEFPNLQLQMPSVCQIQKQNTCSQDLWNILRV